MLKREDLQIIIESINSNSRALDLGCGNGQLLEELIKKKNVKGLGIEISLECIKYCLEQGISVLQEDLNEGLKDFQDKSFDYVVLSQTLEFMSNPAFLLQEMLRVGVKCIISFENLANWKNRITFLLHGSLKKRDKLHDVLQNSKRQKILTVKSFLEFCDYNRFRINKKIFLPRKTINLSRIFPNLFCTTAIFILQ